MITLFAIDRLSFDFAFRIRLSIAICSWRARASIRIPTSTAVDRDLKTVKIEFRIASKLGSTGASAAAVALGVFPCSSFGGIRSCVAIGLLRLGRLHQFGHFRQHLEQVPLESIVCHLEDRSLLVLVDRNDHLAVLHTSWTTGAATHNRHTHTETHQHRRPTRTERCKQTIKERTEGGRSNRTDLRTG